MKHGAEEVIMRHAIDVGPDGENELDEIGQRVLRNRR